MKSWKALLAVLLIACTAAAPVRAEVKEVRIAQQYGLSYLAFIVMEHNKLLEAFGGHKGYGLAFMMQAFGVLAGSGYDPGREFGFLLIVFKPDLLVPLAEFKREVSDLIERIKATPRQPGVDEIRIPSERAFRERARRSTVGIEIDRTVYDALIGLPAGGVS